MSGYIPKDWFYSTGMLLTKDFPTKDDWYNWFVNSYLVEMGMDHMLMFIDLRFSPILYTAWRYAVDINDTEMLNAIQEAIDENNKNRVGDAGDSGRGRFDAGIFAESMLESLRRGREEGPQEHSE